jgi:hypothetical protein
MTRAISLNSTPAQSFLIDDDDYERVIALKWYKLKNGYIAHVFKENRKSRCIYLHRFIMNLISNNRKIVIDHINHILTDNRKENLRICSSANNNHNRNIASNNKTGLKGVCENHNKFQTQINFNNHVFYLGVNADKQFAGYLYDYFARKLFGDFVLCNNVKITLTEKQSKKINDLEEKINSVILNSQNVSNTSRSGE